MEEGLVKDSSLSVPKISQCHRVTLVFRTGDVSHRPIGSGAVTVPAAMQTLAPGTKYT